MFGNFTHGAVLCFGSDGHVSIELEATGCCDESPNIPLQNSSNASMNNSASIDSCGDCTDIPLSSNYPAKCPTSSNYQKSLSETTVSASINNIAGMNNECLAKFRNPACDILASICITVLTI